MGNRWEASGIITAEERDSVEEEEVRQRLEFRERGLEASLRRSKLVPVLAAACGREFSGGSRT